MLLRHAAVVCAVVGPDGLEFVKRTELANFFDDFGLHIGGRALGGPQAVPGGHGVVGQAHFGGAGHIGEGGVALGARHHQRLDAPALDVRGGRAQAVKHHVHIAANQVLQCGARATVRDVGDEGARLLLEQLARQVVRRACAGRAVVELGRVLLHMVEELLEVGRGRLGVDHQHLGHLGQQGQGDEVFLDVVIELGVHGGGNGVVHAAHEQGVAIGRRAGRKAGAHGAARAAAVVNHQRFTGGFGELRGQGARKGIGAPTGRKRHHQVHRLGGPGRCLRPHAARAQQAQARACSGTQHVAALHHVFCCHSLSPVVVIKKEVRPWRSL